MPPTYEPTFRDEDERAANGARCGARSEQTGAERHMNQVTGTDESCAVFGRLDNEPPDRAAIHRFVVGEDSAPRTLSVEEAKQELGDPFATHLLLEGKFPRSAAEVLTALDEVVAPDSPLRNQMSFILGEGSQIAMGPETASVSRNMRFVITRGSGPDGPDIILSVSNPDQSEIELMAWDQRSGGFNYYRAVGDNAAWVFAGNSRHALVDPSQGKGPFESHTSGNFLMKELRAPWINWDSPDANILLSAFAEDDPIRNHPWFTGKEKQGALTCELTVAKPAIKRWTKARFAAAVASNGAIARPARIMQQILDTPTVNLISSKTSNANAVNAATIDLPQNLFVDSEGLTDTLGLQAAPPFNVAGALYASSLASFDVHLTDRRDFRREGDTHFVFVAPERAFEDQEVLRQAIEGGLVSERLAACLLMTDFPNPVFSERRAALLQHVPGSATVSDGRSGFSEEMAQVILSAAEGSAEGSPEREFAERWRVGEDFRVEFNRLLNGYYAALTEGLKAQAGFDDYFRLAESRRQRVCAMPIFESPLLFAQTNIPPVQRVMRADGTVETRAEP
jgi:hypothetical protein